MPRQVFSSKNLLFPLQIVLTSIDKIVVRDVVTSMTVLALKDKIELQCGIPRQLQRLTYFDELDMDDEKRLSFFHVVPNSTFSVKWWPEWASLIQAAYLGDIKGVMASRIGQMVPGSGRYRRMYFNERGYAALYIASHRGHSQVVSRLMSLGIDSCRKMPSGRSPIHVATHNKRIACVNLLVAKSRDVREEVSYRENCVARNAFLNIAGQLERKGGWRLLVMQVKERIGRRENDTSSKEIIPLREFQKYDSTFSTYLTGPLGRIYLCTVLQMEPIRRRTFIKPWKP